jgi:hypothetical protein
LSQDLFAIRCQEFAEHARNLRLARPGTRTGSG